MPRKEAKPALEANENLRAITLKKKMLTLVKKVKELTILCAVKATIMFYPKEAEPMVWPSVKGARDLVDHFFALPDFEKKKKKTSVESYLKNKIKNVHEQLKKTRKEKMEYEVDQLMVQLHGDRKLDDLNLSEIYGLLPFSKDKIIHLRNKLNFMQYPPIRDPWANPFDVQSEDLRTITNYVFMIEGGQDDERAENIDEASKRINIDTAIRDNQSQYLLDQWLFASSEPLNPQIDRTNGLEMGPYNENPYLQRFLPYQGSSSNGNPILEMDLIGQSGMAFDGLVGSVSQPLQHYNNTNPTMALSQSKQYPFEERSNINNGDSQFHMNNNIISTNNGLRQESPPPPNGTITE